eukprot:TRINITY_DN4531_c0_g1_i2.p1 TRINITY_DN4531_c0_g1~~TRINITY_DN4531_c0_g1_i2.p1  ORF type:complete len:213 (+),score=43.46 TRINITY_DN4531_c0_g1_i2:54-641(+)
MPGETIYLAGYPFMTAGPDPACVKAIFEEGTNKFKACIGDRLARSSRMGSSAIPGMPGTPVTDILIELKEWPIPEVELKKLQEAGFEFKGCPSPHYEQDQWFFGGEGKPGHLGRVVIHVVPENCDFAKEMRAFVEYVTNTPCAFEAYSKVKLQGAKELEGESDGRLLEYKKFKHDVVMRIKSECTEWMKTQPQYQ